MLTGSVGSGGTNRHEAVKSIQLLLNDWRTSVQLPKIGVDGIVGPETIGAIREFQGRYPGLVRDGRIDPNGPMLSKLDEVCAGLYSAIAYHQLSSLMCSMRLTKTEKPSLRLRYKQPGL